MFIRKSVKKNKFQRYVFITITVLIAIGLVIPLAGLFQKQPVNTDSSQGTAQDVKSFQEQLATLESRVQENPGNAEVLMELGEAYVRYGKPDQAVKTFEQVLVIDPNNTQARYDMSYVYYLSNKSDLAIAQLKEIISIDPNHKEGHYLYGIILGNSKKDYAAGIQEMEKFIELAKEGIDAEKARQKIEEWKTLSGQN
ncbi:MAG: Outer membrane protein assembly factor BamD [Pelotomaculum sp. PtaB.Bin104]|nr:MAG: Outer membrane protein assembly factor BamD [Pelotomaculum sp. PtaB.Bin104]